GSIAFEELSRHRIAISRLATASFPVTGDSLPSRMALTNACSSARSGSAWPTERRRIEYLPSGWKPKDSVTWRVSGAPLMDLLRVTTVTRRDVSGGCARDGS